MLGTDPGYLGASRQYAAGGGLSPRLQAPANQMCLSQDSSYRVRSEIVAGQSAQDLAYDLHTEAARLEKARLARAFGQGLRSGAEAA
jgi:hypothetical protein